MSTATIVNRLAPAEYLEQERDAEQRHEYLDGELVAMTGGSRRHNLMATRVARLLGNHLESGPCRVYQSDMKVRVERANRFYYPDVMVCCEALAEDADDYFETAPTLIVEVLSPGTASTDDGEKRINLQALPSLLEYLLLDPDRGHAVLYRRGGAFWTRTSLTPEDRIELASVRLEMALSALTGWRPQ